jgi:hypothetical protein
MHTGIGVLHASSSVGPPSVDLLGRIPACAVEREPVDAGL